MSSTLADVADINPTLPAKPGESDLVSFVGMSDLDAQLATTPNVQHRPFEEVSKGYTPLANGDLLVAKITPCFQNGKIGQATFTTDYGAGSTEFHVLRPKPGVIDDRYLLHFLRQPWIRIAGEKRMTGSGGQRRVPVAFLANVNVPLPPLVEQRRIAEILDRADALRAKRRQAIAKLDSLTQSIFIDMFGIPTPGRSTWPLGKVGDMLTSANYGTGKKAGSTGSFPVLRMGNITAWGEIDMTDLKYMDLADPEVPKYTVRRGDVLFNRTNSAELVGKTAIYRATDAVAFAGYLIRLRVNESNDPEYLAAFMNTSFTKTKLKAMCKSIVGMANINATEVQGITIPLPPLEMQQKFADRIAGIELQKLQLASSKREFDALFASLQHRAFPGQL